MFRKIFDFPERMAWPDSRLAKTAIKKTDILKSQAYGGKALMPNQEPFGFKK